MSNQQSYSFSSTSYSSSDGQAKSYTETAHYDNLSGGSITRESRETGQPTLTETREIPVQDKRIEDVDEEQAKRDAEYLERMEDEYAKQEGGA